MADYASLQSALQSSIRVTPFTNDLQNEVAKQAMLNHFNLDESAKRSLLIPKDFF
jgi:hypothetical protein